MTLIDLTKIQTRQELGAAIKELVGHRSTRQQESRFEKLIELDRQRGVRPPTASTSRSVIAYWFRGSRLPGSTEMALLLRSVGDLPDGSELDEEELRAWNEAVRRVEAGILQSKLAEPATRMQEVRGYIIDRQHREYQAATVEVYRQLGQDPSREVLLTVLRTAAEGGLITANGVRVPVWETDLHYRFVLNNDPELLVTIESDNQAVLQTVEWDSLATPEDFCWQLVEGVRSLGADLGVGLNDPTESIEQLSSMLVDVSRLRSQELLGYRHALSKIIERKDNWYFTERHVIPGDQLNYTIEIERLNELDWEEHLYRRFEGAYINIPFARRMYGIDEA